MKKYIIIAVVTFILGSIFKFAHIWSITNGNEKEIYWYIAMVFVLIFIASLIGIFLKFVFRKGIKKFNL